MTPLGYNCKKEVMLWILCRMWIRFSTAITIGSVPIAVLLSPDPVNEFV